MEYANPTFFPLHHFERMLHYDGFFGYIFYSSHSMP
jgi:hypothetical protein